MPGAVQALKLWDRHGGWLPLLCDWANVSLGLLSGDVWGVVRGFLEGLSGVS